MIQAKWLDMTFEINPEKGFVGLLNDLSVSSKVVEKSNEDSTGQAQSNTVARDLTSFSFNTKILSTKKVDARKIAEQWDSHLGDKGAFYIGDEVFLFDSFQLVSCSWNPRFTPTGHCDSVEISLEFKEYAPEKTSAKKASSSKSSSKKSENKKEAMKIDKDAVKKADNRVNNYKSQVDTGASSKDKK